MHSRWLFALGIGTGVLLSGLAARSQRVAPTSGTKLEAAGSATQPRASRAPSKLVSKRGRSDGVAVAPTIVKRPSDMLRPEGDEAYDAEQAERRELEAAFASASREARDDAWASAMEASVQTALKRVIAAVPVDVGKPDCRTRHCQFAIEWSDRDTAHSAAGDVLAMLPDECAGTLTHIDDGQDDDDSYKSRVLLDCPRVEARRWAGEQNPELQR